MRNFIAAFILIYVSNNSSACDCKTITKSEEQNLSSLIFLGDIIKKDDDNFTIKPIEIFKGEVSILNSTLIAPLGECLINPEIGETWLVYATLNGKGIIVSSCGYSRSFNRPISQMGSDIPPPIGYDIKKIEEILIENIYINKALNELHLDIQNLRSQRQQKEILSFEEKNNNHIRIIIFLEFVIIFLILWIVFRYLFKSGN